MCRELDTTNTSKIVRLVDEAMIILWPTASILREYVLILLSDAAPYMVKAGKIQFSFAQYDSRHMPSELSC